MTDGSGFTAHLRTNWRIYVFVLISSLLIHLGYFLRFGPCPSSDYRLIYDPAARQALLWAGGAASFPVFSGYQLFHSGYVLFIALVYFFFGSGNLFALAVIQSLFSVAVFMTVFFVGVRFSTRKWTAVLFILISMTFIDNVSWSLWAVPDGMYRFFFVPAFLWLVILCRGGRFGLAAMILVCSCVALALVRIDTVLYFIPFFFVIGLRLLKSRRAIVPALVFCAAALLAAVLFRDTLRCIVVDWLKGFYLKGYIVQGLGYHIPGITIIEGFDPARSGDLWYVLERAVRLCWLRLFQALNPFPVFWSAGHRVLYVVYMLPIYFFSVLGLIWALKKGERWLALLAYPYAATIMLYIAASVDASKRATFSTLPLLILLAGFGFDFLVTFLSKKKM